MNESPNVVVSAERYQELLQAEALLEIIGNARKLLIDYQFNEFCNALFPSMQKEGQDA